MKKRCNLVCWQEIIIPEPGFHEIHSSNLYNEGREAKRRFHDIIRLDRVVGVWNPYEFREERKESRIEAQILFSIPLLSLLSFLGIMQLRMKEGAAKIPFSHFVGSRSFMTLFVNHRHLISFPMNNETENDSGAKLRFYEIVSKVLSAEEMIEWHFPLGRAQRWHSFLEECFSDSPLWSIEDLSHIFSRNFPGGFLQRREQFHSLFLSNHRFESQGFIKRKTENLAFRAPLTTIIIRYAL